MANLSGLGAFAQGLAGGIQQGVSNYTNLAIKGMELEQEKKKSALQEKHMNFVNDANMFDTALKVVKNAKDIQTAWDYIEQLNFTNPYHKTALQSVVIADTNRQGDLIKFTEKVNELAKNPTPDSFKQLSLLLAEAKVIFGEDSNEYKSLEATDKVMKDAYKVDDITNLTNQVDQYAKLGKTLEQKLQQPSTGMLQQQPTITNEELDIINKGKAALTNLQVKYPDQYKLVAERYGLGKPAETKGKWIDMGHGIKALVDEAGNIIRKEKVPTAPREGENYTASKQIDDLKDEYRLEIIDIKNKFGKTNSLTGFFELTGDENKYSKEVNKAKKKYRHAYRKITGKNPPIIEEETESDVETRFKTDLSMKSNKLGKKTDKGYEVYDVNNKLVGHYE